MLLEEMLKKSKKEGYAEGEAVGYANGEAYGETRGLKQSLRMIINNYDKPIPSYVEKIIDEVNDVDVLNALIKEALRVKTLEEFIEYVTKK